MRRSSILPAVSLSLAVLLTVAGSATAAFGEGSGSAAPSGAIPPGFHAQSVSWISPEHGWMLGSAPCGQDTCT
ncbi:MAG TPA: hypothetical protein VEM93_02175, partial [Actinomycetota bacterium]|nr:hypothetical protein [Actinomycetota bacterium]